MTFYINTAEPDFCIRFKLHLSRFELARNCVFLCIGTDKITGDSLGPYVGSLLKKYGLCVYGTLGDTVNATNLAQRTARIYREHKDPYIIAIDSCLGRREHIGFVSLNKGGLKAGSGVNKRLMPVGNMAIKGIVSEFGKNGFERLVNVSGDTIEKMGGLIARSIIS